MYELFDVRNGRALRTFDDLMAVRIYMSLMNHNGYLDYARKGEGW